MIFGVFWVWLSDRLADYISNNAAQTAATLEPAAISLVTIYVMLWGFLHWKGAIQEPLLDGALRILRIVVVLGVGLHLWQYHEAVVETFFDAPVDFGAAVFGARAPVETVDAIWDQGGAVAAFLWDRGGILSGDFGFYLAAAFVYLLMGAVCVYAVFLMALARIALAVLLALGPLFIVLALFDVTRRFFEAWLAQLANYALVMLLAVLTAELMLEIVQAYAEQTAALGSAIVTVDALNMVLVAALVLLILRQVMPIAARLSAGVSLSTFQVMSLSARRGLQSLRVTAGEFGAGLRDTQPLAGDSWRRRAGFAMAQGARSLVPAPWRRS